jgi:hypothetical protein
MVRAADAAAQLVQLRQAELVGAVHDDGVGGWHVDAGFDDGRAQQQIEALVREVAHHMFQFAFRHLAVGDFDARFRAAASRAVARTCVRMVSTSLCRK